MTGTLYVMEAYADMALLIEANKGKTRHLSSQLIVEKFKLPYKIVDKSTVDDYTSIFPFGKVPGIVEDNGYKLSESMAVTLYYNTLLGNTKQEYASIVQWMSFLNSEVFPKAAAGFLALRGLIPYNKKVVEQNLEIFKKLAQIVEDHLTQNTYFVGERFSLADLYAVPLFKRIFDFLFGKEERKAYPAITRWFSTVIQQDWYSGLMSDYKFIEEPIKYTPPKKEEPKKEKKEEKKKPQPADEPPKEKAAPHPLASLGAAKMPLDEWKRVYSNQETREQALPWFWEHYNPEDYSLWKVSYKYNDELTLVFMSNNLIGGFFARLSSSTKYMFGCEVVYGENNDNGIVGVFLVRGQDFKPAFEVAPDWDGYDYVKLDAAKPEDKTLIEDIWSWDKPYNGKEIADGKVFK